MLQVIYTRAKEIMEQLLSVLYITKDAETDKLIQRVLKRCGCQTLLKVSTTKQAIDIIINSKFDAHFIIEELTHFEGEVFFPIQLSDRIGQTENFIIPPPCIALYESTNIKDLHTIEQSRYIGFIQRPYNENIFENKLRGLYNKSYTYNNNNLLYDIIVELISEHKMKEANTLLLPALMINKNSLPLLTLYAKILYEMNIVTISEKVARYVLSKETDNFSAKTVLIKILLATGRNAEAETLQE